MTISRFRPSRPELGAITSRNSCELALPSKFPFPPNGRRKRRCGRPGPADRPDGTTTLRRPASEVAALVRALSPIEPGARPGCGRRGRGFGAGRRLATRRDRAGALWRHLAARHRSDLRAAQRAARSRCDSGPMAGAASSIFLDDTNRRRRHRANFRRAGAQIRFRARGRRHRAGRRRHDPRHAARLCSTPIAMAGPKRKPKPRYARPSAPGRSSGSTKVS